MSSSRGLCALSSLCSDAASSVKISPSPLFRPPCNDEVCPFGGYPPFTADCIIAPDSIEKIRKSFPSRIFSIFWSRLPDSNRRPHPYHGCALPAELSRRISLKWWREKDLNLRRRCRQIYSLLPLTTRPSLHEDCAFLEPAPGFEPGTC